MVIIPKVTIGRVGVREGYTYLSGSWQFVDAASGDALIRPGDRLAAIRDLCGDLVQEVRTPPGLFVTESRPIGFGLNMARPRRNLLLVTFEDRRQGARRHS